MFSLLVSLLGGASGFAAGILFKLHPENPNLGKLPAELWLIGSAVADIIIASSMTYILMTRKKAAVRPRSSTGDRIIRLLALTLETNAITAAVAIMSVIMFFIPSLSPPTSNFYQLGPFLLGKLYSNCFMVLLNQRYHVSESRSGTTATGSSQQASRSDPTGINIELNTRSTVKTDDMGGLGYNSHRSMQTPPPKAQGFGGDF